MPWGKIDRRTGQIEITFPDKGSEIFDDQRFGVSTGDRLKRLQVGVRLHEYRLNTDFGDGLLKRLKMDIAAQTDDPLPVETGQGVDVQFRRAVHLPPGGDYRLTVELEQLSACIGGCEGDQEIDLFRLQALQTLLPSARNILQPPPFLLSRLFQSIRKNPIRLPPGINGHQRRVVENADTNGLCGVKPRVEREKNQEQEPFRPRFPQDFPAILGSLCMNF